jgi:hypothetical protein
MSKTFALLPNEQIVTQTDYGVLTLTTKRVRYDSVLWGRSHLVSITLGSVASCGLVTRSYRLLLLLGGIAFVASFLQAGAGFWGLLVAGAVLVGAYWFTRKTVISVASNGGESILFPTQGMKREAVLAFVEAVEREKLKEVP